MYWMYALVFIFLFGMLYLDDTAHTKEVSFSEFEKIVEHGGVKEITVFSAKHEAEALLSDSIAKKQFPGEELSKGSVAKIFANIPSADILQSKIEAWQASGKFNGAVKYEKQNRSSSTSHSAPSSASLQCSGCPLSFLLLSADRLPLLSLAFLHLHNISSVWLWLPWH